MPELDPFRVLSWPIRPSSAGGCASVTFGSAQEIAGCVDLIAGCPEGGIRALPDFGVPELAFGQGEQGREMRATIMAAAIDEQEPRAAGQYALRADVDGVISVDTTTIRGMADDMTVEPGQ